MNKYASHAINRFPSPGVLGENVDSWGLSVTSQKQGIWKHFHRDDQRMLVPLRFSDSFNSINFFQQTVITSDSCHCEHVTCRGHLLRFRLVELWPQRLAENQVALRWNSSCRLTQWVAVSKSFPASAVSPVARSVYGNAGQKFGFSFRQADTIWAGLDALTHPPPSHFTCNLWPQLGAQLMQFRGKCLQQWC